MAMINVVIYVGPKHSCAYICVCISALQPAARGSDRAG